MGAAVASGGAAAAPEDYLVVQAGGLPVILTAPHAGEAALSGPESVLGALAAKGHAVIPHARSMAPEARAYLGGFTVQTYSREPDGIDAIQLELGMALRKQAGFVDDLAEAIAAFAR